MDPPAHHQESSDSTSRTMVYTPTTKKAYKLQFTGFLKECGQNIFHQTIHTPSFLGCVSLCSNALDHVVQG
jgi:hypothetical protein